MDRDAYLAAWSRTHGGIAPTGLVARWLTGAYALASPLAARRVSPDAVTAATVVPGAGVVAAAVAGTRWPLLAAVLVGVAGVLDNLDGAVAILTDRVTAWGYVLDSVVDRIVDLLLVCALWRLGAPAAVAGAAGAALFLLEFTRARAGNAGGGEVQKVTVGERPARMAVAAGALLTAGVLPGTAHVAAIAGAATTAGLAVVGLVQLLVAVSRTLR